MMPVCTALDSYALNLYRLRFASRIDVSVYSQDTGSIRYRVAEIRVSKLENLANVKAGPTATFDVGGKTGGALLDGLVGWP